jgi:hypothetical protein
MVLVYLPFIMNGVIESLPDKDFCQEWKQRVLFLCVTICQICQLLLVRTLSIRALDTAHALLQSYCLVFEQAFTGHSTPNMV